MTVFNNRVLLVFMLQMTNLPGQSIVAILQSLHNAYMLRSIYYNTLLCCSIIKCTITITISITTAFF